MFQLSDFIVYWTSGLIGLSLLVNLIALLSSICCSHRQNSSSRLLKCYLLIILIQLTHISLIKTALVYSLWSGGVFPFNESICQATCVSDFALPSTITVFLSCIILHISLLRRLTRNAIALSFGLGLLFGIFVGLQACINDSGTCFGYFDKSEELRKSSDWIISLGTNGFCIIVVVIFGVVHIIRGSNPWDKASLQWSHLSFGVLLICSTILVNIPKSIFYFYIPPSSTDITKDFTLYVLTRLLPDTQLLYIPLGFLILLRHLFEDSNSSSEDELRRLIDTNCPIVLMERLAHSQTTMV